MDRLRNFRGSLSYANVMATVAVFIALGGVAGAAVTPLLDKRGSVTGRHIARGAIHMSDLAPSVLNQIAVASPLPGNYTGRATDGSLTITALIFRGMIVQMSATGDCAFAAQDGDYRLTSNYKYPGWIWVGNDGVTVAGDLLDGVPVVRTVFDIAGGTRQVCETRIELTPV